jgi:hypothetical protein
LIYLSRAIDAAVDAVAAPFLLLLVAALVIVTSLEISDQVRRRRRRSGRMVRPTRYSEALGR